MTVTNSTVCVTPWWCTSAGKSFDSHRSTSGGERSDRREPDERDAGPVVPDEPRHGGEEQSESDVAHYIYHCIRIYSVLPLTKRACSGKPVRALHPTGTRDCVRYWAVRSSDAFRGLWSIRAWATAPGSRLRALSNSFTSQAVSLCSGGVKWVVRHEYSRHPTTTTDHSVRPVQR